jgi:flagellar basal body-associated protein FliL
MGKENPEEIELERELEALYHEVAGEKGLFSRTEKPETPAGVTLLCPSEEPQLQEKKKRKLRVSLITMLVVLSALLFVLTAFFFWPAIQNYDATNSGGKFYSQSSNRPAGKSVIVPPIEDTKPKGQTESISITDSSKASNEKYSIQIRAYPETYEYTAKDFVTDLRKRQPDVHMERVHIKGRGVWYRILIGHFANIEEASTYMKEKELLKAYPGSFVQVHLRVNH